jgi:hypothetical protein
MLPSLLTEASRIELFPLSMLPEDGEIIVGRMQTGTFAAIPPMGAAAIEFFQAGLPLGEVQARLSAGSGVEADLEVFVRELVELGFVRAIDGQALPAGDLQAPHLSGMQARHVAWLFSWPAAALMGLLVILAGLAMLLDPSLLPRYDHFFWTGATSLVLVGNSAWMLVNQAGHELSHLVAARSLGIPARIRLGTRLHNLVALTDVSGLWSVPRKMRYRVYLAGMLWDLIPLSVAALLLAHTAQPTPAQPVLRAILLANWLGILWQMQLYLRSDLYFVLAELMRSRNVHEDAMQLLRYTLRKWVRSPTDRLAAHPLAGYSAAEARKVRAYAAVLLVGSGLSLGAFAAYGVPTLAALFRHAFGALQHGLSAKDLPLIADGAVTAGLVSGFLLLYLVTFLRSRRAAATAALRRLLRRSAFP